MKKRELYLQQNGYILRSPKREDAESYYRDNFCPLDAEVARLTGSKEEFSCDEVVSFFHKCLEFEEYYQFLLISPEGKIIGESVINEIDWEVKSANYRVVIFHSEDCGKGIGSWMVEETRDFAFEVLKLHRLELDVYSFNPRAEKAYLKAGFKREGVLREAVWDGEQYADDILMAILEEEWRKIKIISK